MLPCQDNYATTFNDYPSMLGYHKALSMESNWRTCKVKDLHVEPLDGTSPLYGNPAAFAAGTSAEAVSDTVANLGLALNVGGNIYPVRSTAYKTLLDRAKINGTALSKLDRQELSNVLNTCLSVHNCDALLLKDCGSSYVPKGNKKASSPAPRPIQMDIELPLTDLDTRHKTYTAFLSKLALSTDHRENLLSRGLTESQIQENGYKTLPVAGYAAIAKQLQSEGYYLSGVPGFYHKKDGSWTFHREKRGILIPVKSVDGKIQGLQIRRDNAQTGKFRWVSSVGKQDGCKAECWTHLAGAPTSTVLLTEGPLKADVIHALTGLTVIALPGVNSLSHLKDTLEYVQSQGTVKIMTAFDMDYLRNPHVRDGYHNLAAMLAETGIEYGTFLWDPQYKGLDDYVWHCRQEGEL